MRLRATRRTGRPCSGTRLLKGMRRTTVPGSSSSSAAGLRRPDVSKLPERVSIFGISYLPAFHLEVLKGLSALMDVSLYCLNPCREYWADIMPERRITRIAARVPEADLHMESRNDLLASMGRLGRNFLDMVIDLEPEETDLFVGGGRSTMLERVQDDILNLRTTGDEGTEEVEAW